MQTKLITYSVVLLLMVIVPVLRYYASTPDTNACVLDYVDNIDDSDYKGYMYDIKGVKHLEAGNSKMVSGLKEYKVGKSDGCLMISNNLFSDMNNTFYCTVSYLIRNSPLPDKAKEPLGILKRE